MTEPGDQNNQSPATDVSNLLSALDGLEQALLYVNQDGVASYLNCRGAELLEISGRADLTEHEETLAPLVEISQQLTANPRNSVSHSILRTAALKGASFVGSFVELSLTSSRGRAFSALAYGQKLNHSPVDQQQNPIGGALVCFYDLTYLEPFFRTIAQSRRNRAMIVLASAFSNRALLINASGQDIISAYEKAENDYFRSQPGAGIDLMETDLLSGLSNAVDIVDPLVVSSAKFLIEVKTSALLKLSQPNFLRIICHLLLEAADFVGPFGTTIVQAIIKQNEPTAEVTATQSTNVKQPQELGMKIIAERKTFTSTPATALEQYLYQRYMPLHYKVKVLPSAGDRENPIYNLQLGDDLQGSDQFLSENLRIASHLARQCGVALRVVREEEHKIAIYCEFKLRSESSI